MARICRCAMLIPAGASFCTSCGLATGSTSSATLRNIDSIHSSTAPSVVPPTCPSCKSVAPNTTMKFCGHCGLAFSVSSNPPLNLGMTATDLRMLAGSLASLFAAVLSLNPLGSSQWTCSILEAPPYRGLIAFGLLVSGAMQLIFVVSRSKERNPWMLQTSMGLLLGVIGSQIAIVLSFIPSWDYFHLSPCNLTLYGLIIFDTALIAISDSKARKILLFVGATVGFVFVIIGLFAAAASSREDEHHHHHHHPRHPRW